MKSADLHPEDLIDKRARGVLSEAEATILDAHLAKCAVCRFELAARDELALEDTGELSDAEVAAAIAGALGAVRASPKAPSVENAPNSAEAPQVERPTRRPRRLAGVLLVAAAALTIGSAAAARWTSWTAIVSGLGVAEPTQRTLTEGASRPDTTARPTQAAAPQATVAPTADTTAPVADTAPMAIDTSPRAASHGATATTGAPANAAATGAPANAAATGAPANAASANAASARAASASAALFTRATEARQKGDHAAAAVAYRELLDQHGAAPEAPIARVAFGRMLLDDGDAAGALEQFEAYLRGPDDVLREEAMLGRAVALGRLGRAREEADAWTALLGAVPGSVHAARARARLEELGRR